MTETPYSFSAESVIIRYDFDSTSAQKTVKKIVKFTETSLPTVYNLALLDLLEDGQESDMNVTDNKDLRTVLATVMQIIDNFLTKFPDKVVGFSGSDNRRTRLYRIVISRELALIERRYRIVGELDGFYEEFRPDTAYQSFFVSKK